MFVIRSDAIATAREKVATPDELPYLDRLEARIRDLHQAEREFSDQMRSARTDAGVSEPVLSRAARDEMGASVEALARVQELQRRRCRRAASAVAVIETLLDDVQVDLEETEWMLAESRDEPGSAVVSTLVDAKRALYEEMLAFTSTFGGER